MSDINETTPIFDSHDCISQVPNGFLVRKRFNGELMQVFCGITKFGSEEGALEAAKMHRDLIVESMGDSVSLQTKNANNKTGIVGISLCVWKAKPGKITFTVRYQRPEQGQTVSGCYSIKTHGLWRAFQQAVNERREIVFQQRGYLIDAEQAFDTFLQHYMDRIENEQDTEIRALMKIHLSNVALCSQTPRAIRQIVLNHMVEMSH